MSGCRGLIMVGPLSCDRCAGHEGAHHDARTDALWRTGSREQRQTLWGWLSSHADPVLHLPVRAWIIYAFAVGFALGALT